MAKWLIGMYKCSVISDSRKKNQIAYNHKALVSSRLWRGFPLVPPKFFFSSPRCALRKASRGDRGKNIPPLLAAQSAFHFGPLPSFHKIFDQRNTLAVWNIFLKSLPASLFQREEKSFPPFWNGNPGGFEQFFKEPKCYRLTNLEMNQIGWSRKKSWKR